MAAWSRLIWHAWLQGRWTLAIILMTFTCIAALPIVVDVFLISAGSRLFRVPLLLTPLVAAVIGASMFWFDQRGRQYRFFTDHGVSPRRLWFSRHVVAAAAVVLWCALALLCLAGEVLGPSRILEYVAANEQAGVLGQYVLREEAIHFLLGTVGLGVVCYGVGQLCSLCVRSGVIALFLGLVLSWLAGAWAMMMWEYHVPLWFSVAPIPVYLLWAGWSRAPDWLAERTGWRARVKLAAAIIVPFVAIGIAVLSFRVCEIPVERYEFASQAVRDPRAMTPQMREGTDTALMYAEALHCFLAAETRETTGSDSDLASPDTSSPQDASPPDVGDLRARGLQLFLEAARREECRFPDSWSPPADDPELSRAQKQSLQDVAGHATQLAQCVLATCDALEDEGQVTEAVDRYLSVLAFTRHLYKRADWSRQFRADAVEAIVLQRLADWAALESQTAATLRSALGQLEREHFSFTPERRYGIVADYWSYRKLLDAQHSAAHKVTANEAFTVWFFSRFLPWEHARAKRLLEVNAQAATENLEQMQTNVQAGLAVGETEFRQRSRNVSMANWIETTPCFVRRKWTIGGADIEDRVAMWATTRRIARLQLMLAAWRKDRGSLPQTLDEVLEGQPESFGVDPFTGLAFRYEPAGFGLPLPRALLHPGSLGATDSSDEAIPPDTPLLWSAGPLLTYSPYTNSRPASASHPGSYTHVDYIFRAGSDSMPHPVTSERELWERGLCFPVP
jgi:hypothetical protein